jgi:predicted RNA-binding protein with PUA-like domain
MNYWLLKSEPEVYSIDDLKKDKLTPWEGVRNYQARNFMTKDMKKGDLAFFYHSNAEPSGIVGIMRVASDFAHADATALNKKSKYFDEKASKEKPIWFCVDLEFMEKFNKVISLEELRSHSSLSEMLVLKRGQRLSVQPVSEKEFKYIRKLYESWPISACKVLKSNL